jgi:hypothetical protein
VIALVVAFGQIVVVGAMCAVLLDPGASRPRTLGLSFLLGTGVVSMNLMLLPTWSPVVVSGVLLVLTVVVGLLGGWRFRASGGWSPVDIATLLLVAAHAFAATLGPVWEWDFWAIWGLKARVFFEHRGIDWVFLQSRLNDFSHPDYPLLLPLQYTFVALHGDAWSDRWMGILTTAFGVALILIARDLLGRELSRHWAASGTVVVASAALSPWIGMAEAPMIAYGAAGLLFLRAGNMPAGAALLGLAAFTKNEGLALIAAAAAALVLVGRRRDVLRLWPAVVIAAPWLVLRMIHALPTDLAQGAVLERVSLARMGEMVAEMARVAPLQPWLWVAMGVAFAVLVREWRREAFLLIAVAVQLLFYAGAYLVTPKEVRWHVRSSWQRLLQHGAVPLAFAALAITGSRLRQGADDGHRDGDEDGDDDDRDDDRDQGGDDGRADGHHHADLDDEDDGQDRQQQELQREQRHLEGELHGPEDEEETTEHQRADRQDGKQRQQLEHEVPPRGDTEGQAAGCAPM